MRLKTEFYDEVKLETWRDRYNQLHYFIAVLGFMGIITVLFGMTKTPIALFSILVFKYITMWSTYKKWKKQKI